MGSKRINLAAIERDMLRKGWHQGDLAKAAGLHDATITRFFKGRHQTARSLKRIALALEKPIDRYIEKGAAA